MIPSPGLTFNLFLITVLRATLSSLLSAEGSSHETSSESSAAETKQKQHAALQFSDRSAQIFQKPEQNIQKWREI